MIPISLVEEPVNLSEFKLIEGNNQFLLFLGFIIKNEYDNKRINIADEFKPIKIIHTEKDENIIKNMIPMYGIELTPNNTIRNILKIINEQQKINELSLAVYKNILSQFNMSCDNTYSFFSKTVYPIDFINLKTVCNDTFKEDKKIFQHMLSLNEKQFDFQAFASLKLLILKL